MNNGRYWQGKPTKATEYPEDFKIRVVKEVESGLLSKDGAKRKYGIGGKSTVLLWLRKYGREDYPYMAIQKKRKIEPLDGKDNRIAELEAKLAAKSTQKFRVPQCNNGGRLSKDSTAFEGCPRSPSKPVSIKEYCKKINDGQGCVWLKMHLIGVGEGELPEMKK